MHLRFVLRSRARRRAALLATLAAAAFGIAGFASVAAAERTASSSADPDLHKLPALRAVPMRMDTIFLGGYARGSFADALQTVASDLSGAERTMIGRHLDKIFGQVLRGEDMERGGRLRLAYERAVRPDGTTRSIRVLAAEAAVGGRMHTAFSFEHEGQSGYFDNIGRSLDVRGWIRPIREARISSPFNSQRVHPILNRVLPHLGTDYAAVHGTPVFATGDGSVSISDWRGGYGNLVEVQHPNGYTTRYGHLSRIPGGVRPGTAVRQGDV
ncbi:MAG: peptidoglycan DD-metalloendopeptidase family protein, partial [Gemmatimonadetes bacterium]|nr:peptidoglycan DD-metalloendopeptidase family protein [Gemmatimonadota bacterium]